MRWLALVALILTLATRLLSAVRPGLVRGAGLILLGGGAHAAAFLAGQVRVMAAAPQAPAFAGALNIAIANAGIAAGAAGIAKILFFVFLILAVVSFIANTARR